MKKLLLSMFLLGACGFTSTTPPVPTVTVAWDPSPDTRVTSYNVYYTDITQGTPQETTSVTAPTVQATITGLVLGHTYSLSVTAVADLTASGGTVLESDQSTPIFYTVVQTDTGFKFKPISKFSESP